MPTKKNPKNTSKIGLNRILFYVVKFKLEVLVIVAYIILMSTIITWGLPNINHPFPYFMDESHQLQAMRTLVKYGTSNYPHQENGPMFHYIASGLLVSPLIFLHVINPYAIKSAVSSPQDLSAIYIALRSTIILFGALSLIVVVMISRLLKINSFISILFFITPVFISVSNYFKYDIPFMFWTLLSLYLFLKYGEKQTLLTFVLAGITSALAVSTKITGLPLFCAYLFVFFYFTPKAFKNYQKSLRFLFFGLLSYISTFILIGIPDIVFGGRSMTEYLYYNIVLNPQVDRTINFHTSHFDYLLSELFPTVFGHAFFLLTVVSIAYILVKFSRYILKRKIRHIKSELLIFIVFCCFALSFVPLWVIAANRAVILLPFFVIFVGISIRDLLLSKKIPLVMVYTFVFAIIAMQIFETHSWIDLKYSPAPQATASTWIVKNIPKRTTIGIENIPIYQQLPDLITQEFYFQQYNMKGKYNFNYQIVDKDTEKLPNVIVLSNSDFESKYRSVSPKKSLVERLKNENYKKIATFVPNSSSYKRFTNDINFVMTGMPAIPLDIVVFSKK